MSVPTVAELYAMGRHLAYPASYTQKSEPSTWHITPEGHTLLGEIMRENAEIARAAGAGDWVQPKGSPPIGTTDSPHEAGTTKEIE